MAALSDGGRPPRRRPAPTGSSPVAHVPSAARPDRPSPVRRSAAVRMPTACPWEPHARGYLAGPGPLSRCPRLARGSFTFVAGATPDSSAEHNDPTGKPWAFSRGPEAARRVAAKLRTISQHPGLCGHPSPCGRAWFRETTRTFVFDSGKAIADGLDRRRRRWAAKNPAHGGIGVTAELASVERCSAPETLRPNRPATPQLACVERCSREASADRRTPRRLPPPTACHGNIAPSGHRRSVYGKRFKATIRHPLTCWSSDSGKCRACEGSCLSPASRC